MATSYEVRRAHQIELYKAAKDAVNAAIEAGEVKARKASRTWALWMYEQELDRLEKHVSTSTNEGLLVVNAKRAIRTLIEYTKDMR